MALNKVILAVVLGVILVPTFAVGAQKAITVSSLERAYENRIKTLDAEIGKINTQITTEYQSIDASNKKKGIKTYGDYGSTKVYELEAKKNELEFERKSLTPAYNLLKEAFK